VDTFLNAPDEIIADSPDDGQFIEQLVWSYTKGPEVDPDGTEVPFPELLSIPRHLEGSKPSGPLLSSRRRTTGDLLRNWWYQKEI